MAKVEVEGIVKNFGPTRVLSEISLAIEDGEFLVLVGPSGCGKSTLLRVIAGLEDAQGGRVHINNRDVTDLEPRERDIAMVFQSYALYPHMTVRQNIGFGLKLARRAQEEIDRAVDDAASLLGLADLLDRKPRQLSGGQRQRVAMGRAIVRKPALFLFDEPLSNLDAKLRVQMRTEIRGLHERLAATSIYVTHDQVEAMTMADRIVVLDRGQIMQVGTPLEIYEQPYNRFVAEFIGAPGINILDGEISTDGTVRAGEVVLGHTSAAPGLIDIGIRPEDLVSVNEGSTNSLSLTLDIVEHLGAETYAFGRLSGNQVCWRRSGSHGQAGDRVWLKPVRSRIHLFDKSTGNALPQIIGAPVQ